MASRKILPDVVTLINYAGEVNDEAVYQETILTYCYCPTTEGADLNMQGKKAKKSGILYIFDEKTIAKAADGSIRTYKPYDEWVNLDDKSPYWTVGDLGLDYFEKAGSRFRITGYAHKVNGTRRMHHFEVKGE